jgi:hypothetical protein
MIAIANNVPTLLTEPERIGSRINKYWSKNRNYGHAWRYDRVGPDQPAKKPTGWNSYNGAPPGRFTLQPAPPHGGAVRLVCRLSSLSDNYTSLAPEGKGRLEPIIDQSGQVTPSVAVRPMVVDQEE